MKRRGFFAALAAAFVTDAAMARVAAETTTVPPPEELLNVAFGLPLRAWHEITFQDRARRLRWLLDEVGNIRASSCTYSSEYLGRRFVGIEAEIDRALPGIDECDRHIVSSLAAWRLATGHAAAASSPRRQKASASGAAAMSVAASPPCERQNRGWR